MPKWERFLRRAAYACLLIIVALSLLPAQEMYRTGAPKGAEHFAAYWGAGILMGGAFCRQWRERAWVAMGLAGLAGLMELLQQFSPGRTPHLSDFIASSTGAVLGVAMSVAILRCAYAARSSGRAAPEASTAPDR